MVFKLGFIRKEESLILAVLLVNTLQSIFILLAVSRNAPGLSGKKHTYPENR